MLRLEMLPAREGDCLILSWGDPGQPRRILIDGGRKATYGDLKQHLSALPPEQRRFDLLLVTHVDRDHIEGILELSQDPNPPVSFADVWFNGFHHLHDGDFEELGAVQGERFSQWLRQRVTDRDLSWNGAFGAGKEAVARPADGGLIEIPFGDMTLTLLSPTRERLTALIPRWERECEKAGMVAGKESEPPDPEGFESFGSIDIDELAEEPFEEDGSEPNGSSIAVLAEHGGRRVLLAGDAFPSVLLSAIEQLDEAPLALDAFKIPHHGSRKNLSKELLQAIRCPRYLFSSNGSFFDHPDPVAVSRVIKHGGPQPELWFNYRSPETRVWDTPTWKDEHGYEVHYPASDRDGYQVIELETD